MGAYLINEIAESCNAAKPVDGEPFAAVWACW